MYVKPAKPRYKVIETTKGAQFIVPSAKDWISILVLPFMLVGWGILEISFWVFILTNSWTELSNIKVTQPTAIILIIAVFLIVWMLGWTVFGILAIYQLLWYLIGKEIINVDKKLMTVTKKVLWFGKTKIYDSQYISDLRLAPKNESILFRVNRRSSPWSRRDGMIRFDYGAKTYSFCDGAEEAEAKMIFEEILRRYPDFYNKN